MLSFPSTSSQSPETMTSLIGMPLRLSAGELTNYSPAICSSFLSSPVCFLSFFSFGFVTLSSLIATKNNMGAWLQKEAYFEMEIRWQTNLLNPHNIYILFSALPLSSWASFDRIVDWLSATKTNYSLVLTEYLTSNWQNHDPRFPWTSSYFWFSPLLQLKNK